MITEKNLITTKIYEKELNLYLYLPPHSCHPPGVLKGLIFGTLHRAMTICSNEELAKTSFLTLFTSLLRRGHSSDKLLPIFQTAWNRRHYIVSSMKPTNENDKHETIFLHAAYHPNNCSHRELQAVFQQSILRPKEMLPLHAMYINGSCVPIKRMTICVHRNKSIRDILPYRKVSTHKERPVSKIFSELSTSSS